MRNKRGIATALPLTALALCLTLITGCATSPTPGQPHQAGSAPHHAPIAHHSTGHPAAATPAATAPDVRDAATLKPGEFTWHPERAPSGPVVIIVSIPEQPGASLVVTDRPALPETRTQSGFRIMADS